MKEAWTLEVILAINLNRFEKGEKMVYVLNKKYRNEKRTNKTRTKLTKTIQITQASIYTNKTKH